MKLHANYYALWTNKNVAPPKSGAFPVTFDQARELNNKGFCIFWTMNGFDFGKRTKADLKFINCFYVDLDSGSKNEMKKLISNYLSPSVVISTGKGYHVYWWLEDPIDCENNPIEMCDWFREFIKTRFITKFKADSQAADACRLLRPPFFKYQKNGLSDIQTDIVFETNNFYKLDFIKECFPIIKESKPIVLPTNNSVIQKGDNIWQRASQINIIEALRKLSGSSYVSGENYDFKQQGKLLRIWCNGKPSNAWIDQKGTIGSVDRGGPYISQWLYWYHKDWKVVAKILKEVWPDLEQK